MNGTQLAQAAVPWEYKGKRYLLGHTDLALELIFQAVHQSWAANNLESMRGKVSPFVFQRREQNLDELIAGNRFAFGGALSLGFLSSKVGQFEYVFLKVQKGLTEAREQITSDQLREQLEKIRQDDLPAWNEMVTGVLRRDLPFAFPTEPGESPQPEAPTPSTSEPTSSSAA